MEGLARHTHDERRALISKLVELHVDVLGDDLLALATQGSFTRDADRAFSDVELVAFLRTVPGTTGWADCVQIWGGILIDVIWTTTDEYIARVKEVTPDWYLAGSDRLGALVNPELIEEVNAFEPGDLHSRCLDEALRAWPAMQEATGKVLNAVDRKDGADLGRLFFAMLDRMLIEVAFINTRPFTSSSTALQEALGLSRLPRGFDEIAVLAIDGAYRDRDRTRRAVETVFAGLEELLADAGRVLYRSELALHPTPSRS